jgi:16S rRNA (guanine966-N2)-methyltransferase
MGLECLSRGCRFVTFFESDRSALKRLRENLQSLDVGARAKIVPGDLFKWSETDGKAVERIDLIFMDPPYSFARENSAAITKLTERLATEHLASDGIVIFRHDLADDVELPPLRRYDVRDYGSMRVEFFTHPES